MNRKQFMDELGRLLMDIPDSEREEAIQYYNDYFDDAGEENEAQVIRELGSPAQVARTIREGMAEGGSGYREAPVLEISEKKEPNSWKTAAIVLLCILLSPVILPVGIGILAAAIGLIIGILGILIAVVVSGAALLVAGVITILYGIITLFSLPALGFALAGIGCLLAGIGIPVSLLVIWICIHIVPAMIRYITRMIRVPFRKAGV